jgi:hypothetical protein
VSNLKSKGAVSSGEWVEELEAEARHAAQAIQNCRRLKSPHMEAYWSGYKAAIERVIATERSRSSTVTEMSHRQKNH